MSFFFGHETENVARISETCFEAGLWPGSPYRVLKLECGPDLRAVFLNNLESLILGFCQFQQERVACGDFLETIETS